MANPIVLDIPKNVWTKVATGVVSGFVQKCDTEKSYAPLMYLQTYRLTGEAAPTTATNEGARMFRDHLDTETEHIAATVAIDVYILARDYDGQLRVSV